ncbi:type VI secretion protein [Streptomyces sp. NPDC050504]|uniref:type VI secretion protein n=1 Tax=Streptomyces sp. NPDC050504 TaxID=3365618 RepID=UPI0037ABF53D
MNDWERRYEDRGAPRGPSGRQGGVPDGLLVGGLAFALGVALLSWTATGLAGLFAHGSWPDNVTFGRTPEALKALVTEPHDLAGAWPQTPPAQLSGWGLFWGLLLGQLMVLLVLTIFVLGAVARWRVVRRTRRAEAAEERAAKRAEARGAASHRPGKRAPDRGRPAPTEPVSETRVPHPTQPESPETRGLHPAPPEPSQTRGPHPAPPESSETRGLHPAPPEPSQTQGLHPAPPATEARVPHPAPPAFEARGSGGGAPDASGPGPVSGAATPHNGTPATAAWYAGTPSNTTTPQNPQSPRPSRPTRLHYAPAPSRKPQALQALRDAEGPALVLTSDPTIWADSKDARAKLGPVLLYDPGHLCDTPNPARLHWSPTAHCEDPDTARERAAALLAPVRPHARVDAAMADTAETLLRCWLHAAAVDGKPFKQVHRWAQNAGAHDPVRILRTHPKATSGLAGLLESALTAHPERREIAQQLVARALSSLSSVHIREACTPNRTDSLTLESFIGEGGTLYVVGEAIEDPRTRPGAMPLLTALASHVVEHGRRMAARSSDGRLDPPMTFVLDDVAAVAPLPQLPELLSTGQDQGLATLVLLRSQEQARARWPEARLTP